MDTLSVMTPLPGPSEGLNAALAAELRAETRAQDLTIETLAKASEIPYGTLRRYMRAERNIDVAVLYALASALKMEPRDLVSRAQARIGFHVESSDTVVSMDEEAGVVITIGGEPADEMTPKRRRPAAKKDLSSFEGSELAARDEDRK